MRRIVSGPGAARDDFAAAPGYLSPATEKGKRMAVNTMPISAGEASEVLHRGWQVQTCGRPDRKLDAPRPPRHRQDRDRADPGRPHRRLLFDLRLTTIEPQDLRGLPYYDHAAQRTVWYRPEDLPDDPARPAILFLDELTAAAPALQPTVYGLLQERRVGRHRLPDSCLHRRRRQRGRGRRHRL